MIDESWKRAMAKAKSVQPHVSQLARDMWEVEGYEARYTVQVKFCTLVCDCQAATRGLVCYHVAAVTLHGNRETAYQQGKLL